MYVWVKRCGFLQTHSWTATEEYVTVQVVEPLPELGVHDPINEWVVATVGTAQEQSGHAGKTWNTVRREDTDKHSDTERQPWYDKDRNDHQKRGGQSQIILPPLLALGHFLDIRISVSISSLRLHVVHSCSYPLSGVPDFLEDADIAEGHDEAGSPEADPNHEEGVGDAAAPLAEADGLCWEEAIPAPADEGGPSQDGRKNPGTWNSNHQTQWPTLNAWDQTWSELHSVWFLWWICYLRVFIEEIKILPNKMYFL